MTPEELDDKLTERIIGIILKYDGKLPHTDSNVARQYISDREVPRIKQLVFDVVAQIMDIDVRPAMQSPQRDMDFLAGSQAALGAIKFEAIRLLGE